MKSILDIHQKIWTNIIATTRVETSVISNYRRIYTLFLLVIFLPNTLWLGTLPDALFDPPQISIPALLSGFPNATIILSLHLLIILGIVLTAINKYRVLAGISTVALTLFLFSFVYSLGKIDHNIMLFMVLFCFSLGDWGDFQNGKYGILPIPGETLLAIFLAFGMFTAGILKARHWIDFDLDASGFLSWFYNGYFNINRTELLADSVFSIPPLLIESFDYLAVFFELCPFLVLISGKRMWWKAWILIACSFHLANLLFLNIPFLIHTIVYLPFILHPKMTTIFARISNSHWNILIIVIGVVQVICLVAGGQSLFKYIINNHSTLLWVSLVCWLLTLSIGIVDFRSRLQNDS